MSVQFMVTIVGPERSGLLTDLAKQTRAKQGTWLDSRTNQLDGQFAGLFKVQVPDKACENAVKAYYAGLEGYRADFHEASTVSSKGRQVMLSYDTNDRPGLVNDITHLLADQGVRVDQMECHRLGVMDLGESMFTAKLKLWLPEEIDPELLATELEALDEGAAVSIA